MYSRNLPNGFGSLVLIILVFIILITAGIYLYLNSSFLINSSKPLPTPQINPAKIQTNLNIYRDVNQGFEIELPPKVNLLVYPASVSAQTTDEIRTPYQEIKEKDGDCPGPCGAFIDDLALIDKQFEILSEVAKLKSCNLSPDLVEKITDKFRLFARAIESKKLIEGIYNPNLGICGIRFIAADGYDVSIFNYFYKAGFLKDNKVINIQFGLFNGAFEKIDQLLRSLSFQDNTSCYDNCIEKEIKYFQELEDPQKFAQPPLKEVIEAYDKSVKSFKLL